MPKVSKRKRRPCIVTCLKKRSAATRQARRQIRHSNSNIEKNLGGRSFSKTRESVMIAAFEKCSAPANGNLSSNVSRQACRSNPNFRAAILLTSDSLPQQSCFFSTSSESGRFQTLGCYSMGPSSDADAGVPVRRRWFNR